jgi:hypothetical protein
VWKDGVKEGVQVGFVEVFKKPCPPALRKQLDEALGRAHRIRIEANTADDWLITAGIKIKTSGSVYDKFGRITPGAVYESWKVDETFARYGAEKAAAAPPAKPRGKKSALVPEMVETLRSRIAEGTLTVQALDSMTQETLADYLGVSRETAVKARAAVLNTDKPDDNSDKRQQGKK